MNYHRAFHFGVAMQLLKCRFWNKKVYHKKIRGISTFTVDRTDSISKKELRLTELLMKDRSQHHLKYIYIFSLKVSHAV